MDTLLATAAATKSRFESFRIRAKALKGLEEGFFLGLTLNFFLQRTQDRRQMKTASQNWFAIFPIS